MSRVNMPPGYVSEDIRKMVVRYLDDEKWGSSRAGRAGRLILTILGELSPSEQATVKAYPYPKMRGVLLRAAP